MATLTKPAKVENGNLRMIRFPKEGFFDGPFPKVRMDKELKNIFYELVHVGLLYLKIQFLCYNQKVCIFE